ncbi:MAG: hypothetical protein U0414_28335 [Polyangiaceae bacterium]
MSLPAVPPAPRAAKRRRASRWRRRVIGAGIVTAALGAGACVAIHELPWFGPLVADLGREVVGARAVAWVEDTVYGAEDAWNVTVRGGEKPKVFWAAPSTEAQADAGAPPNFTPPHEQVSAAGDGVWVPVRAATDPGPIAMYKSLVHPDPRRPFAAVAVVAMDLRLLGLSLVAGTKEPASERIPSDRRRGLVPVDDQGALVAVFNGGFKAVHGSYGMRIGRDTFLPAREGACTISIRAGVVSIGTWTGADDAAGVFRQTPPCLVEGGQANAGLSDGATAWGASVGGGTIIRRSALGLTKDRTFLLYGLGDAVSARSLGEAMTVAGASDVAELDVNQSFPRFFLVERGAGTIEVKEPIVPDIRYSPSDYVAKPSERDFFYVRRR